MNTSDRPASPPTTLTPFIHFMRLRRLESKIEHVMYRAWRSETTPAVIEGFLNELTAWKDAIPLEYHDQPKGTSDCAIGIDNFVSPAQYPSEQQENSHHLTIVIQCEQFLS